MNLKRQDAEWLMRNAPSSAKKLFKEGNKLAREKARKEWYAKNKKDSK